MIPYSRQNVTQEDIDAVIEVLRSDFLTQGPMVPRFESAVAAYCGASQAVAVNSATSALHIACLALGLGPGDRLWTSPITFVASANCALYCGAQVDFVDIDPRTYNLSVTSLEDKLKHAEKLGKLPKIVIAVHLCGQSCDMQTIHALSQKYGFSIIEDASHAIGGKYLNKPIGNCHFGQVTVFSFHPVKIITTGEGGMVMTNDAELARKMRLFRSHGITRDPDFMTHEPEGSWYYQQIELGFNYRMTDIAAALGISQLKRIEQYVARRQALAKRYDELLSNLPVSTPWQHPDVYSALHIYPIRLITTAVKRSRHEIFEALRNLGIGVNVHYIPVHMQPYYQRMGFRIGDFPEAERYYDEAITLPIFPTLTDQQQNQIASVLTQVLSS